MDVAELFDVIDEAFGRRRFLQHSPISPDVWEAFIDEAEGPLTADRRCDLLLTAASGSEPGRIADALREGIARIDRTGPPTSVFNAAPAANASSVVAQLTLEELVCVAAPLTHWWRSLPEGLKAINLVRQELNNPAQGISFEASARLEFFSFAATAGLVHMLMQGFQPQVVAERERRRANPSEPTTRSRVTAREVNPHILEMLQHFDTLWANVEFLHDAPLRTEVEHIYPNRRSQISVANARRTIKADASENLFHASTADITWAVVDSGIDATHPAFRLPDPPLAPETFSSRVYETYDFTQLRAILADPKNQRGDPNAPQIDPVVADALQDRLSQGLGIDWSQLKELLRVPHVQIPNPPPGVKAYKVPVQEHGTHVAGIIGANWPVPPPGVAPAPDAAEIDVIGVCPDIRLMDIRVFGDDGTADEFTILSALQFLGHLNRLSTTPLVHGANLSFSLVHKVRSFACGRTPVCEACERLVKGGIVVVAAAGNAGYTGDSNRPTLADRYAPVSITDPGNAEAVITVGSTHKFSPFSYGVSYFSSRGPTGDGRAKPDILAPGEKILSTLPDARCGEMDGTSQAAPHVSGAAAILLARYPELIGDPDEVKRILCENATSLGRERSFQGAGLVDILRALQAPWRKDR